MKSCEIWGTGPFDNAVTQDLAFRIRHDPASKKLAFLNEGFAAPIKRLADALAFVAQAELLNLVTGHSAHASHCPLLADWAIKSKIRPPAQPPDAVAGKLRDIAANPKFARQWGVEVAEWRSEVEETARKLEAWKKPRPLKPDEIALKTLKTLVANRPDRDPDSLYPMARGSKDVHINFSHCDPRMAIAMTRYPSVVSLLLNLRKKSDEAVNLIPFRILLQRWCDQLSRFECDVAPKSWNSQFLDNYLPELQRLSRIEVFETVRFDISDAVVEALARSSRLREIRISCEGNGPTAASLRALEGRRSMKMLWLRGARITRKAASAFADANPHMVVDIN